MAGSRLHKLSSIMERLDGLIESKAVRVKDIPLWYDIYKRYPPTVNPVYDQPVEMVPVKPIFYPEDIFRAEFHASPVKVVLNLNSEDGKSIVLKCKELFSKGYSLERAIKQTAVFLKQNIHVPNVFEDETTQK